MGKVFKFDLQRFKGNQTVNNTYEPSEYELALQKISSDYAEAVAPNARYLNDTARKVLENSLGTVQVDFNRLNQNAQNQIDFSIDELYNIINSNSSSARDANKVLEEIYRQQKDENSQQNKKMSSLEDWYADQWGNYSDSTKNLASD